MEKQPFSTPATPYNVNGDYEAADVVLAEAYNEGEFLAAIASEEYRKVTLIMFRDELGRVAPFCTMESYPHTWAYAVAQKEAQLREVAKLFDATEAELRAAKQRIAELERANGVLLEERDGHEPGELTPDNATRHWTVGNMPVEARGPALMAWLVFEGAASCPLCVNDATGDEKPAPFESRRGRHQHAQAKHADEYLEIATPAELKAT